ncbi:phage portal protein [Sinorhizobium medicae]|uniref:phage portal protein n=1 Tax=Sinorhizobium medicae TaxID=110321 RepID=UPI000FD61EB7|nr:phage portal protein [Sinorhizobium medicae]RVJ16574.1 phage portal protein [Sinorhizobium medicae]
MGFLSSMLGMGERYAPADSLSSPRGWLVRAISPKTKAGVAVNEFSALQLPVVYACVNRIANPIARFPLRMYQTLGDGGKRELTEKDHPFAAYLGLRPNEFMSSRTLRKTTQGHALLWGNGYLEIERNGRHQAVGLYPLLPDRTRPVRENGRHFFRTTIEGKNVELEGGDVIHIMDQSQDGYVGISQIAMARQAVGMGLAMEEFGAKFFANDMKSGGFLMHPGKLSGEAKRNIRGNNGEQKASPASPAASLESQSGLDNAHKVKVLEEGMKFIQTSIPPEDAQFLGSREFQIAEIARIYDVPLILLQSQDKQTSFGAGIEQLMIAFVRQTIDPWVNAWEEELNFKLFTEEERARGYYVKFNMNALLRGDMKARAEYYKSLFGVGGLSPNKILRLEDMDGIGDAGDHHFVPANFVTLDRATDPSYQPTGAASADLPSDKTNRTGEEE